MVLSWLKPANASSFKEVKYLVDKKEESKKAWIRCAETYDTTTELYLKLNVNYYLRIIAQAEDDKSLPYYVDEPICLRDFAESNRMLF